MRFVCPALALLAFTPTAALADGPAMSCTGKLGLMLQMGLVVQDPNNPGVVTEIATQSQANVLDLPECQCNSPDLSVEIKATAAIPQGTQETFEVWVGSSCDNLANRTNTALTCERVSTTLSTSSFWNSSGGTLYQRVPVRSLISPNTRSCGPTSVGNQLWFLFYNDPVNLDASCSITLQANTNPVAAPANVTAGSGDGAVTIQWTAPADNGTQTKKYQMLCADAAGHSLGRDSGHDRGYSTCTSSGIKRRTLSTGGTIGGTDDGGTAPTPDAGTFSVGIGIDDNGVDGGSSTVDGGTSTSGTTAPGVLNDLDPSYICSDPLDSNITSLRIDGLDNGKAYQFVLVAIDNFGNPTPSTVVNATPEPVDDFYRRFREEGGKAQGFCFIATAAHGSYESPYVRVLRDFRDQVLLDSDGGRAFVAWYYDHSPPAASYIAGHEGVRFLVRLLLWPVIALAALWLALGPGGILALALALALVVSRRRIRRAWLGERTARRA